MLSRRLPVRVALCGLLSACGVLGIVSACFPETGLLDGEGNPAGTSAEAAAATTPTPFSEAGGDGASFDADAPVVQVLAAADGLQNFVIAGDKLYWSSLSDNTIFRIEKGGSAVTSFAYAPGGSTALAASKDNVLWAELAFVNNDAGGRRIVRCPLDVTECFLASTRIGVRTEIDALIQVIAVGQGRLYASVQRGFGPGQLVVMLEDGGAMAILGNTAFANASIGVDEAGAYIPTFFGILASDAAPEGAGMARLTDAQAERVAVGNGYLYFTVPGDPGEVRRCTLPACADEAIFASGPDILSPAAIAFDAERVYWTTKGTAAKTDGAIMSCPHTGCPNGKPTVVASGQNVPVQIALDEDYVYWGNTAPGSIRRISKR